MTSGELQEGGAASYERRATGGRGNELCAVESCERWWAGGQLRHAAVSYSRTDLCVGLLRYIYIYVFLHAFPRGHHPIPGHQPPLSY